ncbi:hypothetical protein GYMLUDRAFT_57653 [Collybiopsis luxurians FD-317 M1]|uniref:RNI-like protein n=1 Tax=Collybiopsis luxurians FD-317 M1 TaxID=944289 RepID=A0A0D0D2L2_9AGAR|nr:hypothetical protein GYMLUDRAFT_57653 [Collybiopsis luxurians FD-317 M1]
MTSSPIPPASPIPPSPSFPPHPPQPVRRASTSSVTIPIPGKSILKKPPPPPTGLLSRITSGMGVGGMSMGGLGKFFGGGNTANNTNQNLPTGSSSSDPPDRSSTGTPPPDPALKRAHFILPHMAVVYPISSNAPPRTPTTQMEKKAIEERERERRKRVVSGETSSTPSSQSESSASSEATTPSIAASGNEYRYGLQSEPRPPPNGGVWWNMDKVEAFYKECCVACDEPPDPAISRALLRYSSSSSSTTLTTLSTNATTTPTTASLTPITTTTVSTSTNNGPAPRTLDLTGVSLTPIQAEILADVLSIEWGLRTLVLCESNLDPIVLKPILHALLLNNTLIYLSVASNAGLAAKTLAGKGMYGLSLGSGLKGPGSVITGGGATGWVVLEAYLARSNLKVLDLSKNVLDKKAMEGVVRGALGMQEGATSSTSHPPPSELQDSNLKSSPTLISLTLDSATLKSGALDVLARAVRSSSSLRTLSLRNCRIGSMGSRGGIAVSLMIRDWPDTVVGSSGQVQSTIGMTTPTPSATSSASSSGTSTPTSLPATTGSINRNRPATLTNLDLINSPPATPTMLSSALPRNSPLPPSSAKPPVSSTTSKPLRPPPRHPPMNEHPPTHPSTAKGAGSNMQTTYTPYIPRSKRAVPTAPSAPPTPTPSSPSINSLRSAVNGLGLNTPPMSPMTPMTPTLTTVSRRGGVTAASTPGADPVAGVVKSIVHGHEHAGQVVGAQPVPPSVAALKSASATLLSQVRALDALPRIGSLRTLDLRGNELRNHISYLAQVLKRNRTLKTLNLQDNKIDPKALAVLAEALKYNAALEELDLGRNPCCGVVVSASSLASATAASGVGGMNSTLSRTSTTSSSNSSSSGSSSFYNSYTPSSMSSSAYRSINTPSSATPSSSSIHQNPNHHPGNNANANINLGLEGIHALRLALALNTTLTRLSLSATHLGDAGAIALAEWMGEYRGLRWLDLTRNSAEELGVGAGVGGAGSGSGSGSGLGVGLGEAGVMALAQGVKVNRTLRCLDVEVPPGVEGYARLSREILNTCIRNVEASAKEQQQRQEEEQDESMMMDGGLVGEPGGNADLEEAKMEWRVTKDPVHRARDCVVALKTHLDKEDAPLDSASAKGETLLRRCQTALDGLAGVVSGMLDSSFESAAKEEKMREVLELSDELSMLIDAVKEGKKGGKSRDVGGAQVQTGRDEAGTRDAENKEDTSEAQNGPREKPNLRVNVPSKQNADSASAPASGDMASTAATATATHNATFAITDSPTSASPVNADEDFSPIAPSRSDKGKARAPPEPVRHEPVLSPTAALLRNGVRGATSLGGVVALELAESEDGMSETEGEIGDDYGDGGDGDGDEVGEPEAGVRSRNWVAEEGEVFRKGNALLGPEEMEGEYAGEELRRELLEAMVERPAPRRLDDVDDYEAPLAMPSPLVGSAPSTPLLSPATPSTPSMLSSSSTPLAPLPEDTVSNGFPFNSPGVSRSGGTTPTQELVSASVSPRPYVARTRSSSSSSQTKSANSGLVQEITPAVEEHGQPRAYISRRRSNESVARVGQ